MTPHPVQRAVKRAFDITASLSAIVVLMPLLIFLGVWVGTSSPGGVFFRQKRTGYKGRTFSLLKFRSMYSSPDEHDLHPTSESERVARVEKRVTLPGRVLRLTSLDELPQLWNILVGDMSLIGPRPHMLAHTDYYTPLIHDYMRRHDMRPGLTGLAQVRGFRGPTPELIDMQRRVEADLEYVDNFSLALDTRIFFRTLGKIITLRL